jgi:hypothetical protein
MGSVILWAQSDPGYPLINKSSILPSADMIGVIDAARKDEFVNRAASAFEPDQNATAGGLKEFELNGPGSLLLNDDRACENAARPAPRPDLIFHPARQTGRDQCRAISSNAAGSPQPSR